MFEVWRAFIAETSLTTLIKFDAIMTSAIDSLSNMTHKIKNYGNKNNRRSFSSVDDDRQAISNKEGTVPQKSIRRMKEIFSVIASNQLLFCHARFCRMVANKSEQEQARLANRSSGSVDGKMYNQNRSYTICFRIPDTGYYYVGLTINVFQGFICDCMGNVSDCYILYSRTSEGPFLPLNSFFLLLRFTIATRRKTLQAPLSPRCISLYVLLCTLITLTEYCLLGETRNLSS